MSPKVRAQKPGVLQFTAPPFHTLTLGIGHLFISFLCCVKLEHLLFGAHISSAPNHPCKSSPNVFLSCLQDFFLPRESHKLCFVYTFQTFLHDIIFTLSMVLLSLCVIGSLCSRSTFFIIYFNQLLIFLNLEVSEMLQHKFKTN